MAPTFSSLLTASKDNDAAKIRELVAAGLSPNETNQIGQAPLHVAAIWGNTDAAVALLAAGAEVDAANQFGVTPLHYASQNGKFATARALLDAGARTDIEATNGKRAWEVAKDNDMQQLLGAPTLALHGAVRARELEAVRALVAQGEPLIDELDPEHRTPLHLALACDESADAADGPGGEAGFAVLEALLHARGGPPPAAAALAAALGTRSGAGLAPIHLAVATGSAAVVGALLGAGADPSLKTLKQGEMYSGSWLRRGADGSTSELSAEDQSALHLALDTDEPDLDLVRQLLEANADVDARDAQYRAPIHHAIEEGCHDAVQLLLGAKADTALGNKDFGMENSCLHQAVLRGDVACVKLLLGAGAAADAPGRDGWTPLCHAARSGSTAIAKALLEGGAAAGLVLPNGKSALELARANKKAAVVALLEA